MMQQEILPQDVPDVLQDFLQSLPDDRKRAFLETQAALEELAKLSQELGLYD